MKRIEISKQQLDEIKAARKENKNKKTEKRLQALQMRGEGKSRKEIQIVTGFTTVYISNLVARYCKEGLDSIIGSHYKGNRRNMSYEEEEALLSAFTTEAKAGKMVDVAGFRKAYVEKIGHEIGHGQIYYVLHRHGWRKIMPRSQHPNKASDEAIEASKKLTQQ